MIRKIIPVPCKESITKATESEKEAFRQKLQSAIADFNAMNRISLDDLNRFRLEVFGLLRNEASELGIDYLAMVREIGKGRMS